MKFSALLPVSIMLLLLPSCRWCCKKETDSCYRKACPTTLCNTPTYRQEPSSTPEVVIQEEETQPVLAAPAQESIFARTDSENFIEPEVEEVNEEDELTMDEEIERETPPSRTSDKEALDEEIFEEE